MQFLEFCTGEGIDILMAESSVSAGFPSPAADYMERGLNLQDLLVDNPAATFFVRVEGESMTGAGIHPGDILVVDRSLEAASGNIVIAALDGEMTVKRLRHTNSKVFLVPENPEFDIIAVQSEQDFVIWGVVTTCIHSLRGR